MTELNAEAAPVFAPTRLDARQVTAVTIGNALDFYDFLSYAFFAAQIGRTFFPADMPGGTLLPSLATFGAGFLMRPVGAFVLGLVADRIGRKPAMLLSFSIMGVSMGALALIPPYAAIGVAAPMLAIACRLAQGFALGGEVGPSTAFLVEAAPANRRGFYVSLQYLGQDTAVLVAGIVGFVLARMLTPHDLDAWGWRVAFGLGVVIVPFGLILRRQLVETLHRTEDDPDLAPPPPSRAAFVQLVILGLMILAGGTTVSYVLTYLTTYATTDLHMSEEAGFAATIVLGLCGIIFDPVGGILSDRFGRKVMMVVPWAVLVVITIPLFAYVSQARSLVPLLGMAAALSILSSVSGSSALVALTERLPKATRSGALGLTYAFAISIFGGTTQFNVAALTAATHSNLAPAIYMTVGVAVALVAMILLPSLPRNARSPA